MQNGVGKSVFGRWLKDLRSGQNREPKNQRPLGRTLSANVKDKDRKKKVSRTLSANQKDRKKDLKNGDVWENDIFQTRNYKSLTGEEINGYLDDPWTNGGKYRERSFSNPSPDRNKKTIDGPKINRSALVSYLDEEGLKKREDDGERKEKRPELAERLVWRKPEEGVEEEKRTQTMKDKKASPQTMPRVNPIVRVPGPWQAGSRSNTKPRETRDPALTM